MRDYKNLEIWRIAKDICLSVYRFTMSFPREEIYGLTSQMRRASVSIASNISEGCGRSTDKDFISFLHNSMGSLKEVECQTIIAFELGFISKDKYNEIMEEFDKLGRKLFLFIRGIKEFEK